MDSLERQRIESQISQLIDPYIKTYHGKQGIRITNLFTEQTSFEPEFLDHLPSGTKSTLEVFVKRLNAS